MMLSKHNIDMISTRESLKVVNANTESLDFEELESVMWRKASTCPVRPFGLSNLITMNLSYSSAPTAQIFPRSGILVDEF